MRLWLIRHARPLIEPGICYGRLDVAADAEHTCASAQRLLAHLPSPPTHIWHSPRQRCTQLAQAIQGALQPPHPTPTLHPDNRLAEMDFGDWEGRPWNSIGEPALRAWTDQFAHHRPGGGESLAQVLTRVASALQALRSPHPADVVWVTHAGVIRAVQWLAHQPDRFPTAAEWPAQAPAYGEWLSLNWPAPAGLKADALANPTPE